jgi:hypothetical protein
MLSIILKEGIQDMFDKTINVKTIDLSGINLPTDDETTCDLIYSALSTTYGFPIYMENFKVNGVKHDSVLVNPIISENQTIINLNDCYLIVTPTKISVGKGAYGASLESIVDKDGNPRFVEGNITMNTIEGVTQTYGKWSLSGTHLMIAIVFEADANTVLPSTSVITLIPLPKFIADKITPLDQTTYIEGKLFYMRGKPNWWASTYNLNLLLAKNQNNVYISTTSAVPTITSDCVVRIQFDLLIDAD